MLISEYFSCVNYNPLSPEGRAVPTTSPPSNFSFRRHNFNSVCQLLRDFFFSVGELTRGKGNQYLSVLSWQASPWGWEEGGGGGRLVIASATQPSCPRRVPIAKHCLFQENLPHRRRAFPNVAFLSNFRCQDEKSSVGNLLTRLKDTFIFDSRKQV